MDRLLEYIKGILETYVLSSRTEITEVYLGELNTKTMLNYPIIALIDLGTTTEIHGYGRMIDTHTIQIGVGISNMAEASGAAGGDDTKNNPKYELRKIVEERETVPAGTNKLKTDTVLSALNKYVRGNTEYAPIFNQSAVAYDVKDSNAPDATFATFTLQIKGKPYFI